MVELEEGVSSSVLARSPKGGNLDAVRPQSQVSHLPPRYLKGSGSKGASGKGSSKSSKQSSKSGKAKSSKKKNNDFLVSVEFTLCYEIPGLPTTPSEDQVEELEKKTMGFYKEHFTSYYGERGILVDSVTLTIKEVQLVSGNSGFCAVFEGMMTVDAASSSSLPSPEDVVLAASAADFDLYNDEVVKVVDGFEDSSGVSFGSDMSVPSSAPTTSKEVGIDFTLTYEIPGYEGTPTTEQLEELRKATNEFYNNYFSAFYADQGVDFDFFDANIELVESIDGGFRVEYDGMLFFNSIPVPTSEEVLTTSTAADTDPYGDVIRMIDGLEGVTSVSYSPGTPTVPPSEMPSVGPSISQQPTRDFIRIPVTPHFMAYGVPGLSSEPSGQDLAMLLDVTRTFWTGYLEDFFAGNPGILFDSIELTSKTVLYNAGFPERQFNYYVEFDIVVLYEATSSPPPGSMEIFQIMSDADFAPYIIEGVRSIPGFETCDELDFREILTPFTSPPSPAPSISLLPTPLLPSDSPSLVPSPAPTSSMQPTDEYIRIRVVDHSLAYGIPLLPGEPSEQDLQQLREVTQVFWTGYLEDFFADNPGILFDSIELTPKEVLYNAGIPEPQFNYYVEFDTVLLFDTGSSTPPGPMDTFLILSDADFVPYIINGVRSVPGFESCDELDVRAIELV